MDSGSCKIIGITGGSGSGKSMVAKHLCNCGGYIIDADKLARDVVEPGRECLVELVGEYGREILQDDGSLNRRLLGTMVFGDEAKLKRLNEITHKYIVAESEVLIEQAQDSGEYRFIVLDAPLLLESGLDSICDAVLAVLAQEELRMERIVERDGLSFDEAKQRIRAQQEDSYYEQNADFVVYNNGTDEELYSQVDMILTLVVG